MNNQFTWLHIGLGSFHRAHQAWYLHRLIASGDNRWRIAAGNIRNDAEQVVQALAAQGGRYVLPAPPARKGSANMKRSPQSRNCCRGRPGYSR
ncbi:D-arabinitol dehydrogenase [Klebsiella pneumoniae]|nr:D-arabinitol dehydrogenase [Klebsiella pneumoniae]